MDYSKFSKKELAVILEIIHHAAISKDENDIRNLLNKVNNNLICGDYNICGIGKGGKDGVSDTPTIINGNYPIEWLNIYGASKLYLQDPIIWHNFQRPGSQIWKETYDMYSEKISRDFIMKSTDFGLCNGVSGGVFDSSTAVSTIFTFSGKDKAFGPRQKEIMSIVSPHLHQALLRIYKKIQSHNYSLSKREIEIISWIKEGKTNWEISMILNISERTVKFHVQNIERKLNAVNKTHAIAILLGQNLVA